MNVQDSMRDKIADILDKERKWPDAPETAGAIVDALPSMVVPLVWEAGDGITASQEYLSAHSSMGGSYWTLEGELGCSFDMDAFNEAVFNSADEAKAAAQIHHVTQTMAAFGVVA